MLDLAKYYMYQFHYGTTRSSFDFRLLYNDTDSLLYRINCEDLYRELEDSNVLDQFDFSNYPEYYKLYSEKNKRVVLKFKDEFAGDYIKEFLCLKAKLYSITSASECFTFNDSEKLTKYQLTLYDFHNLTAFFFSYVTEKCPPKE